MAIRIEHGKPETLITAAQLAGAARKQEDIQKMQMEFDYRQALRQQDMAIDLQMQERAKQWEIDKMQLRSQIDFQREEQKRQKELDSYDNIESQINKEVQSGRMSEEEAEPYLFSNNLNRQGANISPSQVRQLKDEDDEEGFGIKPYWEEYFGPEYEGTPERVFAEAKRRDVVEGRAGTVPYYLDPRWLRENRDIAMTVLESKEIMLEEDEIDAFIEAADRRETEQLPLAGKQLDVGVRSGGEGGLPIISQREIPTITSDEEYDALSSGTEFVDQGGRRWRKP